MDLFSIIVLGVVQGITEWLPVSSKTIDTAVYLRFLGGKPEAVVPLLLYLHLGTLLAAILYFRKQIADLAKDALARIVSLGIAGAARVDIPAAVRAYAQTPSGFYIAALAATGAVAVPLLVLQKRLFAGLEAQALFMVMGAGLMVTALLLHSQKGRKRDRAGSGAGWFDGLCVGVVQGFSAIPGLSRSGTTTTALIWRGFDTASAFELSFMLSIPTVAGAEMLLWGLEALGGTVSLGALPVADGLLVALASFVVGYATIGAMINLARKLDFSIVAAAFGLLMIGAGWLGAA